MNEDYVTPDTCISRTQVVNTSVMQTMFDFIQLTEASNVMTL